MENWENLNLTIETQPYTPENAQEDEPEFKSKFHWSWRINQLALPKWPVRKYVPVPVVVEKRRFGKIDPECEWRTTQLATPMLLRLTDNKKQVRLLDNKKIATMIDKYIQDTVNNIYHYYFKKRREMKLRKLAARLKRLKKKKMKTPAQMAEIERLRQEHIAKLATPKAIFLPEPQPKIWRELDELMSGILRLAEPRAHIIWPPKPVGVSPQALKYRLTAHTALLAEVPERYRYVPPPPPPPEKPRIKVKDMKIILSERMKEISAPRPRSMKKDEDLKENPWGISPTALKYKATPRILELSKPIERD